MSFASAGASCTQLPAKIGRVFMVREWLAKAVDDICQALGITGNHGGVMRCRARMPLREPLGRKWFAELP